MCGGPPGSQTKMTEVSVAVLPSSAARHSGNRPLAPMPPRVRAPRLRNWRRESGPGQWRVGDFMQEDSRGWEGWRAGGDMEQILEEHGQRVKQVNTCSCGGALPPLRRGVSYHIISRIYT